MSSTLIRSAIVSIVTSAAGFAATSVGIVRVMSLSNEHGRQPVAPDRLHRREDVDLVVHHDVSPRRVVFFDLVEHAFLVDVDEHLALDRAPQTGALHFARLKDDVAVREDDDRSAQAQVTDGVERARVHAVGKRVVEQIERDPEHARLAWMLDAVPLQRAEIVRVAELGPELLEDLPVALLTLGADRVDQMTAQILDHRVVVEQRVVDIHQKDDVVGQC